MRRAFKPLGIIHLAVGLLGPVFANAVDIPGIQPAAYDQPQIYGALVRSGDTPLVQNLFGDAYFKAFLDTGASSIVLAPFYAGALGFDLPLYTYNSTDVVFSDEAVGGSVDYNLSEPLELRLAAFQPHNPINDTGLFSTVYNQSAGIGRLQLGPIGSSGDLNVVGMPAMLGKVVVIDPKPLDAVLLGKSVIFDQLHSYIYNPGTPYNADTSVTDPGTPVTDHHIQLTMVDVSRFTGVTPAGADPATLAQNPFIGPNPLVQIDAGVPPGSAPGITITRGGLQATGSFLLDTGAAVSFISEAMAAQLNIRYRADTFGTASPILESFDPGYPGALGTELVQPLRADVSGIGGSVTVLGFYLDSLLTRTTEGAANNPNDPAHLRYLNAPVFVYDIALQDPEPAQGNRGALTLDGVFGMNMLVASALLDLSNPLLPVISDLRLGPFDWLVFDEPNALLGVAIGRSIDDDADDDTVRDAVDLCPLISDPVQNNFDGDSSGDACDDDDDNDGTDDTADAFPFDSTETTDTDGDGTGNNADLDDDNDGLSDEYELVSGLNPLDGSDCPRWICPAGVSSGWRVILGTDLPETQQ